MQIKIYFYIQWPWDNNATGIVVEYQLIVAAIAPSYVSRSIKGDVHPGFFQFTTFNRTGWTVTEPMVGMTRSWEGGLAVWERFEELNIVCDD